MLEHNNPRPDSPQTLGAGLPKVDDTDLHRPLSNAEWCESVYCSANGDLERVPWSRCGPDGMLLKWLGSDGPRMVRPGCRACVVGCGLGDDVAELAARGFDVLGFDVAPSAVRWAARRFPSHASRFLVSDLLDPPARLLGRFDLVIEICTLQSLAPELRPTAATSLARLLAPRGVLLAISCGKHADDDGPEEGPPWPLSVAEMGALMESAGLKASRGVVEVECANAPDHVRVMGTFFKS